MTKFLVRAENVPMVPLGDVDPDLVSVSAMLMMDRENDGEIAGDETPHELSGHGQPNLVRYVAFSLGSRLMLWSCYRMM